MKKMGKTAAAKFMKSFSKQYDEVERVTYTIGDEEFAVDIYTNIMAADLSKLIEAASIAGYINGRRDYFYRDCTIAKLVIEFFTSIPVPKVPIEDGEIDDLYTCYDIVYGFNGLIMKSSKLSTIIDDITFKSDCIINDEAQKNMPINVLSSKLLDLYEIMKVEINDMKENPVAVDNILKLANVYLEDINKESDK